MDVGDLLNRISFGSRLSALAKEHPHADAIVHARADGAEEAITWEELDRQSNRAARLLGDLGVDASSFVAVGLGNHPLHFVATFAGWKLGACVLSLNPRLPAPERKAVLASAGATAVVADWETGDIPVVTSSRLGQLDECSDAALPDRVPHPGKAVASGGSTGRPKVIIDPAPWARVPGELVEAFGAFTGFRSGQNQLVAGPLYHNAPFLWSHFGLFEDHTLVLLERFDERRALDLIERHAVNYALLVPTMMRRMIRLPDIAQRDLSSIEGIFHTGGPCPAWVKKAWIDLVGADKVYEAYGSTENVGAAVIRGTEWLEHEGSVGRPYETDLRILDGDGNDLPSGQVGEIFMRPARSRDPTYVYRGAPPIKSTDDGYMSVGDLGWVDDDGYLYIADRRVDLIISGGVNVYAAEVEAAVSEHPGIRDVVVIGLPDEEWGRRVHALVVPADATAPPSVEDLANHCRDRLPSAKVPKSFELVDALPRNAAGKIQRRALVAERADDDTMIQRKAGEHSR